MTVKFRRNGLVIDSGECLRNLNLLAHAQMIELEIGSRCGGYGECAGDRLVLEAADLKKVNAPTEIEKEHFSAEELARGLRLACQCFPNQDNDEIIVNLG